MRIPKPVLAVVALAAVPGLAFAGSKVTSGDQSLQITAKITPAKAGTKAKPRAVALALHVDYESLNNGMQVKENTKSVVDTFPKGTTFHPTVQPACKASDLSKSGPTACPGGSQVGSGTATADARPAVATPLSATVTLFNGSDDLNPDGTPRSPAVPALLLYADTSIGATATLPFDIKGSKIDLEYAPPASGSSQLFHIQKVDVTIPKSTGKPYVTGPTSCPKKGWTVSMAITNFDGPSITATTKLPCKKK